MSNILKFPLQRVQRRSYEMPEISHEADILVFEGVRYEKASLEEKVLRRKKRSKIKS